MTPEELDRIDAEVAEKVMGIVWDEKRCRACGWPIVPEGEAGCWASNCSMRPIPSERADRHAQYTRSGDAMLEVVEKMRALGWGLERIEDNESGGYVVGFEKDGHGFGASADTMPVAACLCALAAVGHPYTKKEPA